MRTPSIVALALVGVVALVAAAPPNGGVSTSIALQRTRFLSTDEPKATLTIVNRTTQALTFSRCDITILEYDVSAWRGEPSCTDIYNINAIRSVSIAPSTSYVHDLTLPKCRVNSDPCTEYVQIRYAVNGGSGPQWYTSPLLRYEFFPDPAATFDISGLSGNLPLFIAPGTASERVFLDSMVLEITTSASEYRPTFQQAPELVAELQSAFHDAGLRAFISGPTQVQNARKLRADIPFASPKPTDIAAPVERIRESFNAPTSPAIAYFRYQPTSYGTGTYDEASAKALQLASELAAVTGAHSVRDASNFARSEPRAYLDLHAPWPSSMPTTANVVDDGAFIGTHIAALNENAATIEAAAGAFRPPDSRYLSVIDPQAVIAADRPELYVFGTASAHAALERGLAPYFAAALDARARTQYLGTLLGVRSEDPSLFVAYPMRESDDLRTLGVATTFSGGDWHAWQRMNADTGVKLDTRDESYALVPIEVTDSNTTITEVTRARAAWPPDAVRLDVEFVWNSAGNHPSSEAAQRALRELKRLPYVNGVATASEGDGDYASVRYEVVLKDARQAHLSEAFRVLRSSYDTFHPIVRFGVRGIALNCSAAEHRLLKSTIRANAIRAESDALRARQNLRKLLLAAVLPLDVIDACDVKAIAPGTLDDVAPNTTPEVPKSSNISLRSLMIFRTFIGKSPTIFRRAFSPDAVLRYADFGFAEADALGSGEAPSSGDGDGDGSASASD